MLTRLALVLSLSIAAAGITHAAIPRHEATGLVEERSGTVIDKNERSPIAAPVIAGEISLAAGPDAQS